jgi:DNA-binding IclR family transcriptional regulator
LADNAAVHLPGTPRELEGKSEAGVHATVATRQNGCHENPLVVHDEGVVATLSVPPTKSRLLAELLRRPETYEQMDSAWRLVMWLMLVEGGTVVCGYEQIAGRLGGKKHTVKHWVTSLVAKGVIERKPKGNQMALSLTGDYMRVATAPDAIQADIPATRLESPVVSSVMKVAEGAKELGGQVTITITGCDFGGGKQ